MTTKRPDRVLGLGHDTFWAWCDKGELRLPRCRRCSHLTWPVALACEKCGHGDLAWDRVSGRGTLASWCTFEREYYQGLIPVPYDTILVELEEGPLFISNPFGFDREAFVMGASLTLRFLECEDGAGRFSLPVFALT